jgi:hypothetical protein
MVSDSTVVRSVSLLPLECLLTVARVIADVWTPLLPFLPPTLRFVAYNQRGYTGSSPAFDIKREGGVDAAGAYLSDAMEFFRFAVEELGAKTVEEGGVVLLVRSPSCSRLLLLSERVLV